MLNLILPEHDSFHLTDSDFDKRKNVLEFLRYAMPLLNQEFSCIIFFLTLLAYFNMCKSTKLLEAF